MAAVDWSAYQQCPVCGAPMGEPCMSMSGWCVASIVVEAKEPHTSRKLRVGR